MEEMRLCRHCSNFKSNWTMIMNAPYLCKFTKLYIYIIDQCRPFGCDGYKRKWWKFWIKEK